MIKQVPLTTQQTIMVERATTIADAVRLATHQGVGDFWANRLEHGRLESAVFRNRITGKRGEILADECVMRMGVKYGRVQA